MNSPKVPPRRIIPPAMPSPAASPPPPVAYTPPRYEEPSTGGGIRLAALSLLVIVLVAGGIVAIQMMRTPSVEPIKLLDRPAPQLAAATQPQDPGQQREQDAAREGWVGVLELPAERAIITIATLDRNSPFARAFAERVEFPLTLATISVDNTNGSTEIAVDPSGAMLHKDTGVTQYALDAMQVLAAVKRDRDGAQRDLSPPFRCRPGQTLSGKILLMPPDLDPRSLQAITLHVNMQPQRITGTYLDAEQKAKLVQTGQLRIGGS